MTKPYRDPDIVPLHSIDHPISLWPNSFHGRTLAFKDLALSLFPYLLTAAKNAGAGNSVRSSS